jgi:hypothetical protein
MVRLAALLCTALLVCSRGQAEEQCSSPGGQDRELHLLLMCNGGAGEVDLHINTVSGGGNCIV